MDTNYIKTFKKISLESFGNFFARSSGYIISFVASIVFARMLGADDYGIYLLGFNIVSMLGIITLFGMDKGVVRYIGEHYGRDDKAAVKGYFISSLVMNLVIVLCCILLILAFEDRVVGFFKDPKLKNYTYFIVTLIFFSNILNMLQAFYQGIKRPSMPVILQETVLKTIKVVFFIILFYFIKGPGSLYTATILAFFITGCLNFLNLKKVTPFLFDKTCRAQKIHKKRLLWYSSNLFFTKFTTYLENYVNSIIVGIFLVSKYVGFYSTSQTISGFIIFIYSSVSAIFISIAADYYHNNKRELLARIYGEITRLIIFLTIPLALTVFFWGNEILSLYGPDFKEAYYILAILAIGKFVVVLTGPNEHLLAMANCQKYLMMNGIIVASTNIVLNVIFVPRYGLIASGISSGICICLDNILKYLEVLFILKINPYNKNYLFILGIFGLDILFIIGYRALLPLNLITLLVSLPFVYLINIVLFYFFGVSEMDKYLIDNFLGKFSIRFKKREAN